MPNQLIDAYNDLKGENLLPVHWGKYSISVHSWTDPMDKLFHYGKSLKNSITTPVIGAVVNVQDEKGARMWWKD